MKLKTELPCATERAVRLILQASDRDLATGGYPEICLVGEWRRVCNGGRWTETEALVACRQLGFRDGGQRSSHSN